MQSDKSLLVKLKGMYDRIKKFVIYLALALILLLIYFGDFLGDPLRSALLPAATIIAIAIMFETLQGIEDKFSHTFYQARFASIIDGLPTLSEAVSLDPKKTTMKIMVATGGTTLSTVLPKLARASKATEVEISIYLFNPDKMNADWIADHWPAEARLTIERMKNEIKGDNIKLNILTYDNTPAVHGIMINEKHLLIGFYGWRYVNGVPKIAGAEKPHLFFRRHDLGSEYYFDLFEDWLANGPKQVVFSSTKK